MQLCTLKPGKDCCLFHRDLRIILINIKNRLIIFVTVTVLKMLLYVGVLVFWDKRNEMSSKPKRLLGIYLCTGSVFWFSEVFGCSR